MLSPVGVIVVAPDLAAALFSVGPWSPILPKRVCSSSVRQTTVRPLPEVGDAALTPIDVCAIDAPERDGAAESAERGEIDDG